MRRLLFSRLNADIHVKLPKDHLSNVFQLPILHASLMELLMELIIGMDQSQTQWLKTKNSPQTIVSGTHVNLNTLAYSNVIDIIDALMSIFLTVSESREMVIILERIRLLVLQFQMKIHMML